MEPKRSYERESFAKSRAEMIGGIWTVCLDRWSGIVDVTADKRSVLRAPLLLAGT